MLFLFDLALTGGTVALMISGILLIVIALILAYKSYLKKEGDGRLTEKYKNKKWASPLEGRAKYPEVDVFSLSGPLFRFGLLAALGIVLLAFSWTQYEKQIIIPDNALEFDEEIEMEPPRTAEPPPPPPPPPPPVIEEVPDEEILEEDEPVFVDQDIEEETVMEEVEVAPPPPPPPPPKDEPEEIFRIVEDMPRFPGCENAGSKADKKKCATEKLLKFIYANIKYPAIAKENGVEGTAVVQFVVEKNGEVKEVTIARDIGAGCGTEAARVVKLMNKKGLKWTPGKQRGRAVRVRFTLPIKFKLE